MNQSEFLEIICNLLKALEKSRVQDAFGFGFGFASRWLKSWREIFSQSPSLFIAIAKMLSTDI